MSNHSGFYFFVYEIKQNIGLYRVRVRVIVRANAKTRVRVRE